jgi:hypothetical protein
MSSSFLPVRVRVSRVLAAAAVLLAVLLRRRDVVAVGEGEAAPVAV